jgi:hypothetical protein
MNDSDDTISLGDYLVRIAADSDELGYFLRNPERAMANAGVIEDDRDIVLRGNLEAISRTVVQQLGGTTVALIVYFPNWPIVHW